MGTVTHLRLPAVTLRLSRQDAGLVRLALMYLEKERQKAVAQADQRLPADQRDDFLGFIEDDLRDARRIKRVIEQGLTAR